MSISCMAFTRLSARTPRPPRIMEPALRPSPARAMWPAASVSGYYFGHSEAKYFGLGKIKQDQVQDFAERKNIKLEEAQKWLAPNIVDS